MVINTKGPSASGKSTLRPLQNRLAGDIGAHWGDFALISPDIWRKQLLDYGSLGAAYKYAGAFTAEELQIVDQQARPLHGAQARARRHDASADRSVPLRQLRARFGRGGQQSADSIRTGGVPVFRDHAARVPGRAGVEARPRVRALQGGGRHAGACLGRVHRDSRFLFHLGSPPRQAHPLRISGQHGTSGRAPAHGRIRRQSHVQCSGHQGHAGHRALRPRQCRCGEPARPVPGSKQARGRAQHADFCAAAPGNSARSISSIRATGRIYLRLESGRAVSMDTAELRSAVGDADIQSGIEAVAPDALRGEVPDSGAPQYLHGGGDAAQTLGRWGAPAGSGPSPRKCSSDRRARRDPACAAGRAARPARCHAAPMLR